MTIGTEVIQGALKLKNFMESKCFSCWEDFIAAIPEMFSVEVPSNITNVTVGNTQPLDSERDHLWVRTDSSGSPIGLFIYSGGTWNQFLPPPNQIYYVYGDSRNIPPGYELASASTVLTASQILTLQKTWHAELGGWYSIFHVVYTGF